MSEITGRMGRAESIDVPEGHPRGAETVRAWLITAPPWGPFTLSGPPLWDQWMLGCVRLREGIPGFPPPIHHFDGTTHEVHVMSLSGEDGRYTAAEFWTPGRVKFLQPQNVALQFIATDPEMLTLTDMAAQAVVDGLMCPEAWQVLGGNQELTAAWLTSLTKTLAHIRGEEHAP